jgi:hypothetical protein
MQKLSKNRKNQLASKMGAFLQQYRRKAQKGQESNDRRYDRNIEQTLRRLKPGDLDALLNGDEEDERLNAEQPDRQRCECWSKSPRQSDVTGSSSALSASSWSSLLSQFPIFSARCTKRWFLEPSEVQTEPVCFWPSMISPGETDRA